MLTLSLERLQTLIHTWRDRRIGVLGDFVLDAYWYADMTLSRLSRETPLYPRPVVRETYSPGGAANVAANLASLGVGEVLAFTVLARDWRSRLLLDLLAQAGVNGEGVLFWEERLTPMFGKVILCNQELQQEDARLDFLNPRPLSGEAEAELLERVNAALPDLDALIVADYLPNGILSAGLRRALNELAGRRPGAFFVADSREAIQEFSNMIIKPNELEARRLLFPGCAEASIPLERLQEEAQRQVAARGGPPAVITLGARGCLLVEPGGCRHFPVVPVSGPVDPVGAGDTFLAAFTASLTAGAGADEACQTALLASAVTVQCLKTTGSATPEQILRQYQASRARTGL